ncbi:MAG TPA: T9SS type A sorting domain-containing protein [Flavobacteriales bacterium]|nr:T9SS type A sorting domain-containing protein [Flavobacteriales bacterium]
MTKVQVFFTALILLCSQTSKGQYFLYSYSINDWQWVWGLEEQNSSYYTIGTNYKDYYSLDLIKFDGNGDTTFWKRFKQPNYVGPCRSGPVGTDSTTILLPYTNVVVAGTELYPMILLTNELGDSISSFNAFGSKQGQIFWGIKNGNQNAFIGYEKDSATGERTACILITNNLGQTMAYSTWPYFTYETQGIAIDTTIDNGYVATISYITGDLSIPVAVKFDSMGNYQWHQELCYGLHTGVIYPECLTDGNIIFTGYIDLDNFASLVNSNRYVAKTTNSGLLVWENDFGMVGSGSYLADAFVNAQQLSSGNLIVLGSQVDTTDSLSKVWLSLMDTAGTVIWDRNYLPCSQPLAFPEVLLSSDKSSLLVTGYTSPCPGTDYEFFALKVDTFGCIIPGCSIGIEESFIEASSAIVFPNPSNSSLTIQFANSVVGKIFLSNSHGELILTKNLKSENQKTLDLGLYPKGVYLLSVLTLAEKFSFKIVIH